MKRKTKRVVLKGDKFKIALAMADAGIPFIFVKSAGQNTVGDVPQQHIAKLSRFLSKRPEFEGRYAKMPWRNPSARFTDSQLARLARAYAKLKRIDPGQSGYGRLSAYLDKLTQPQLKQLARAQIKFLSKLAHNRLQK